MLFDEQIEPYVDGRLDAVSREIVETHVSVCPACAERVRSLMEFAETVKSSHAIKYSPAGRPNPAGFAAVWGGRLPRMSAAAAAVVVAALIGTVLLRPDRPEQPSPLPALEGVAGRPQTQPPAGGAPAVTPVEPPPDATETSERRPLNWAAAHRSQASPHGGAKSDASRVVLALKDGGGEVRLDARGQLTGMEGLPAPWRRAVRAALARGEVARPRALDALGGTAGTLLGDSEGGVSFALLGPLGTVVEDTRPKFRWRPLEGAESYTVDIFDARLNHVATSGPLTVTEWRVPQPLTPAITYSWQVTALRGGEEVISPRLPAPQAKFAVLSQAAARELGRARRDHKDSHLLLGVLYAEAGLVDQAEREFQALAKANPQSPVARRLLRGLRRHR